MQWCVVQGGDSNCPPSELTISAPWTVFPWPYFPSNLQLHLCFLPSLLRTAPQINSSPALDVGQDEVQAVWVYVLLNFLKMSITGLILICSQPQGPLGVPPWIPLNAGLSFLCICSQLQRAHRPRVTFTSFCVKIFHVSVSLPLPLKCPSSTLQISSQLPYLQALLKDPSPHWWPGEWTLTHLQPATHLFYFSLRSFDFLLRISMSTSYHSFKKLIGSFIFKIASACK